MNKVPVCSFSDAKIRHLFGAVRLIATYCDLLRLSRALDADCEVRKNIIFVFIFLTTWIINWRHGI